MVEIKVSVKNCTNLNNFHQTQQNLTLQVIFVTIHRLFVSKYKHAPCYTTN